MKEILEKTKHKQRIFLEELLLNEKAYLTRKQLQSNLMIILLISDLT